MEPCENAGDCGVLFFFRDVSSVELLMNNHQGIKAEIDARNDSFTACIELGKALLARKHYASEEVQNAHFQRVQIDFRRFFVSFF